MGPFRKNVCAAAVVMCAALAKSFSRSRYLTRMPHFAVSCFMFVFTVCSASGQEPVYGANLEGFSYPFPVSYFSFESQRLSLHMAYMDVRPATPNGRTVVLFHGKNFCAATWEKTIKALVSGGYRVIAPDQIGFCKSDKPEGYHYSFQQLAENTLGLLKYVGVSQAIFVAHSTGGMVAVRTALASSAGVQKLVLVDPIGLEDWKAKGVPWLSVEGWYKREITNTADRIRTYEKNTYYAGQWKPEYEVWVQMLAGMYRGPGRERVAWASALLYDMIYTQPVMYEFGSLTMPTVVMIGDKDTTAIGKDLAPPELRAALGNYPVIARRAVQAMPDAQLVEFPELGHSPQIQDAAQFNAALLQALAPSSDIQPTIKQHQG